MSYSRVFTVLDKKNRNTPKVLGNSNDDHMFNSHLKPSEHQKIAELIGTKCEIDCLLDGMESKVLLDTGAQVSFISRDFLHKFFPNLQIQPIKELSD